MPYFDLLSISVAYTGSSDVKESVCSAGDPGLILRSGRYPEEGNGNPLEYSCLDRGMDRGAWRATVHGVTESDMLKRLRMHACYHFV